MVVRFNKETLRDRIHACWLGKNIGGTMGAPYEGTHDMHDIQGYASAPGQPLPNDDLDLQLVWLKALAEVGPNKLDAKALGEYWLSYVGPPWNEYGIGKANMLMGIVPPMSGELNNDDWKHSNGAWIRTEVWACTHPGLPEKAIRFAYEDSCVDHGYGEGTYAAIFVAALQSAAFVINNLDDLVEIALSKIPENCRVARSVKLVYECYEKGMSWSEARNAVVEDSADLGWFQAPANVAFAVLGMKYGDCDFKKSMITAINCGDDTDCTAATVGATLGIMFGTKAIPDDWRAYIGDSIITLCIIKGSAYFPETCSDLTDLIMDIIPVTTYGGLMPKNASGPFAPRAMHSVEVTDGPDEIPEDFDPAIFKGRTFAKMLEKRAQYSFVTANETMKALVEFEKAPEIAPGGEIKLKVTVTQTGCRSYRRFALKWYTPEGFAVSGKTNIFSKWAPGFGADDGHMVNGFVDDANFAEVTITAGEKVDPVNRLVLEITAPNLCQPLLVPIAILG